MYCIKHLIHGIHYALYLILRVKYIHTTYMSILVQMLFVYCKVNNRYIIIMRVLIVGGSTVVILNATMLVI